MNIRILFAAFFLFLIHHAHATPADTSFAGKRFSKQLLSQDVDYLTGVIIRVHPDMYHNIGKARYQRLADSVKGQLRDSMSQLDAWPIIGRLVGALNEGHSTFDFPKSVYDVLKGGSPILFPLLISGFANGHFVVKADVSNENKLLPGDEVTAINGIRIPKLVDMLSVYAGGLQSFRAIDVYRNISVCLFLYHIQGPYEKAYW